MITMPILIPLADLAQMSRQLMITAFQVGDGLSGTDRTDIRRHARQPTLRASLV